MSKKLKKRKPNKKSAEVIRAEKEQKKDERNRTLKANALRLLCLVAVTVFVFVLYRFLIAKYPSVYILIAYTAIATAATLAYVIYNRGFSRRGITVDMLPDTMSKEEKEEFVEDGKRRIRRSRPLFIVIFAFAFTFLLDILELFAFPFFKGLFGL